MSLRARILLLVLLAATLPAAAFVLILVEYRQARIAEAGRDLSFIARAAAEDLDARIGATSQMLYGLARARDIDTSNRAACSEFLATVLAEHPQYTGLLTITPDGNLHCDSLRSGRNLFLAERAYFKEALASERPALDLVFGKLTGVAVMQVALAARDTGGQVKFVLLASIDLNLFVRDTHRRQPHREALVHVWDREGTIMAAHPTAGTAGKYAGRSLADSALFRWLRVASDGDIATYPGSAELLRTWAVAVPATQPGTGLRITIGVPHSDLTAEANRELFAALAALGATLLLACAGALALAELGIRRPVARLTNTVSRIRSGDHGARVGEPYAKGELGGLMSAIDATADRIQAQSDEILDLNVSLERRVAERTAQLEEANRAKSDFLANMSHELRTPLNSIIGFSEILKDGVLGEMDAKRRTYVVDIFDAGTHLLSLINDILDLSKVEAGMLELEACALDVAALLNSSLLVVREKALSHRIRLDMQIDPTLGAMLADERTLKQIVFNLLSNAFKFTPEGGTVTLTARRCARSEVALDQAQAGRLIPLPPGDDGEFLAICVADTGIGIAEDSLPKLFQPFTQVDSSVARRHGGTGLGLSLVRRLAELHGGTVGVTSRPGAGSRFTVWLPYREAAADVQNAPMPPAATAASAHAVPLALVIEDDDSMADLIARQLRAEGFQVMRAATAEEGLVCAAKRRPQLITLDIFLPAMDGWEFMRRLKADPNIADTPVVIITLSEDLGRGLALGARRVLQKPFAREELVAALVGLVAARPDGEAPCVLAVDDNVKAVELVAAALGAEGYRVLRAYGGAEAIEAARRALPDLVILDLMMPDVSGFEVARALRESEQTARIPILVLTAMDLTTEERARLSGAVSVVLTKASFSRNELLAEVRRALPKRAGD